MIATSRSIFYTWLSSLTSISANKSLGAFPYWLLFSERAVFPSITSFMYFAVYTGSHILPAASQHLTSRHLLDYVSHPAICFNTSHIPLSASLQLFPFCSADCASRLPNRIWVMEGATQLPAHRALQVKRADAAAYHRRLSTVFSHFLRSLRPPFVYCEIRAETLKKLLIRSAPASHLALCKPLLLPPNLLFLSPLSLDTFSTSHVVSELAVYHLCHFFFFSL